MGLDEAKLEFLEARQAGTERDVAALQKGEETRNHAVLEYAKAREQTVINEARDILRAGIREESAAMRQLLDARFGELSAQVLAKIEPLRSCLDEEERRRELLEAEVHQKPDREEFERLTKKGDADRHDAELALDRVVARIETEIDTEIRGEKGLEPRLRKLEDAPGTRARRTLELVGAGAVPVAGYGLFEFVKSLVHKGGTP